MHRGLTYRDCDVAVIFGSWKLRFQYHHLVKNEILFFHSVLKKKPFIVLETPILGRKIEENYRWFRVGVNHYLNTYGEFNNKNMDSKRWDIIRTRCNIELFPYRSDGDHVVVALQVPGDAALQGTDISTWAATTVDTLREYTNRPILIRPHKVKKRYNMDIIDNCLKKHSGVHYVDPAQASVTDNLDNAWATVTFTSGFAVDSLLKGVPTFACHKGNMAYPRWGQPLAEIEQPRCTPREQWLYDLAYAQWHVDEIECGLPWLHLREVIAKKLATP
jgi:hypothetical protein